MLVGLGYRKNSVFRLKLVISRMDTALTGSTISIDYNYVDLGTVIKKEYCGGVFGRNLGTLIKLCFSGGSECKLG
jgi:hypothetical protein